MKFIKTLAIGTLLFASVAHANTPSDASINKLAEIMPYEQVFGNAAFGNLEIAGQALAHNIAQDAALSDKQREEAFKTFTVYAENLTKQFDTPAKKAELKKAFIAAAKKTYTQAEVDALIAFHENQVLQSALSKGDAVIDDYLTAVQKSTTDTIAKYEKANRTKMEDSIKRILNK